MPSPSTSLATLRPELAGSFQEFSLNAIRAKFGALRVAPMINVGKAVGSFGKLKVEALAKYANTKRAPGSAYGRGNFDFTTDTYTTTEYGWEEPIDDAQAELYADFFDAELIATQRALWRIHLDFELDIAQYLMTTSLFGSGYNAAAAAYWSNKSAARSIADIQAGIHSVYNLTGVYPNCVAMPEKAYRYVINSQEIIDRLNAGGAGEQALPRSITLAKLAEIYNVDEVIVVGGSYDSAKTGQNRSMTEVWDKTKALVFYKQSTQDISEPGLMRTFHWGQDGSMPQGIVESYREENVRGDIVRARRQLGYKLMYKELGYLITGVLNTTD